MAETKPKEPDIDLDGVEYAVVDTNFGPHGYPDISRLEQLASNAEPVGIQVGVPEIVVWEWAEHLHRRLGAVYQAAKQANGSLTKAGLAKLDVDPGPSSASEVAAELAHVIGAIPNVVLIPASKANALNALRDQILQQGAGIKKGDVKTGAADSSWIRDALDLVGGDTSRLVFASENSSDITAAFKLLGKTPPSSGAWWVIKGSLAKVVPTASTSEDVVALRSYVRSILPQTTRGGMHADEPSTEIPVWQLTVEEANVGDLPDGAVVQSLEVIRLTDLVAMTDEEMSTRPGAPSVRARFNFIGDVDVDYYLLDLNGEVQSGSETLVGISISVDLEFVKEHDTWVYESSFDAYVDDAPEFGYDESSDYLDEVTASLCTYFNEIPEDWPLEGEAEQEFGRQGTDVHLSFDGDRFGDWTIDIEVGELSAQVGSTYNPDNYIWAGKDGIYIRPPYEPSWQADAVDKKRFTSLEGWLDAALPKQD